MRHRPIVAAASALILSAVSACDNIDFGRADVRIVPAPPPAGDVRIAPDESRAAQFGLPTGSVLFHLTREGGDARLIPVAEITGDSLRALRRPANVSPEAYGARFAETVFPPGSQFEVFRRGASVGTFVVEGQGRPTRCGVPTASGNLTVVAAAADVPEFLAFRKGLAPEVRGEYSPPQVDRQIRTYASIVAERLILQAGLPRPRSWTGAQRDLQALQLVSGGHMEMAATYLVGDSLAVGPADPQGYSVFYLAGYETRRGYTPTYTEVRRYADGGKAAPQVLDHLNWDQEEGEEVLVEVFGRDQSWYEVISQDRGETWNKVWEAERC